MIGVKFCSMFLFVFACAQSMPTIDNNSSDVGTNLTLDAPVADLKLDQGLPKTGEPLAPNVSAQEPDESNATDERRKKPILIFLAAEPVDAVKTKGEDTPKINGTKGSGIAKANGTKPQFEAGPASVPTSVLNDTSSQNKSYVERIYDQLAPKREGWTWYDVKMVVVIVIVVILMMCLCCACATLCVWCCDQDNSTTQPEHRRQAQQYTGGQHHQVAQQPRGRTNGRFGLGQRKDRQPAYRADPAPSHQVATNAQPMASVISQVLAVPEVQRILAGASAASVEGGQGRQRTPSPTRIQPSIQQGPMGNPNAENDI